MQGWHSKLDNTDLTNNPNFYCKIYLNALLKIFDKKKDLFSCLTIKRLLLLS